MWDVRSRPVSRGTVLATFLLGLIPLATVGCAQAPGHIAGDWAGWLYLTAGGDSPLQVHVRERVNGLTAALDLPPNELFGDTLAAFDVAGDTLRFTRTSSRGTEQSWVGVLAGDAISGELFFDGEAVGVFELHRSALPLPNVSPERYADCVGAYRFGSGRSIIVSRRFWGELLYLDTTSGRFATLFPTSDSTFFAGSAMYVPDTVVARATCRRVAGGVTGLVWSDGTGTEVGSHVALEEEEVKFQNGDVSLAGTLIKPTGPGPFPAAVVLGGSSWETRGSQRADGDILASAGMAVLIYDKRGYGESGGAQVVSFEETASDARAAVNMLGGRADIISDRIGLTGRSRGGWFAPLAAAGSDEIAFVVLFVAPAVSPAAQETTRRLNLLRAQGLSDADVSAGEAYLELQWHFARTGEGWEEYAAVREEMEERGWLEHLWGPADPDEEAWKWTRLNMFYDPVPALERLTVPVLAIYGELDDNVVPELNVPVLEAALRRAGNRDHRVVIVPGADHSLRLVEELGEPLHRRRGYAPQVWGTVLAWLRETVVSDHRF